MPDSNEPNLPLTPLTHAVLVALGGGEHHGYALLEEIADVTDGAVRPGTGTLYAALRRLQDEGLIEDSGREPEPGEDSRRRYYRLTRLGRRTARAESMRLSRLVDVARRRNLLPESTP